MDEKELIQNLGAIAGILANNNLPLEQHKAIQAVMNEATKRVKLSFELEGKKEIEAKPE